MPDPITQGRSAQAAHRATSRRPDAARSGRRTGASLLLWILLLIVVIATAWYFMGRQHDRTLPPEVMPIGDAAPEASRSPVSLPPASPDTGERAAALPDRDAFPLDRPAPVYPATAQRAGEQGTVLLEVEVGADGTPGEVSVVGHSGSPDLDHAAVEAVRGWTFEAAIRDGEPATSRVQVPVEFRLDTM